MKRTMQMVCKVQNVLLNNKLLMKYKKEIHQMIQSKDFDILIMAEPVQK